MLKMIVANASRTFVTGTPLLQRSVRVGAVPVRRATTKAAAATPEEDSVEKPTYTKKMLIDAAATQTGLPVKDVGSVIDSALDIIINRVAAGDKVQFIGFGTFEPRSRQAREGRNPSTGEAIQIAASTTPAFVSGKRFKDTVKGISGAVKAEKPAAPKKAAAPKK